MIQKQRPIQSLLLYPTITLSSLSTYLRHVIFSFKWGIYFWHFLLWLVRESGIVNINADEEKLNKVRKKQFDILMLHFYCTLFLTCFSLINFLLQLIFPIFFFPNHCPFLRNYHLNQLMRKKKPNQWLICSFHKFVVCFNKSFMKCPDYSMKRKQSNNVERFCANKCK